MSKSKPRIDIRFFAKCYDTACVMTYKEISFDKMRFKDLEDYALRRAKEKFSEFYVDVSDTRLLSGKEVEKYIGGKYNE